MDFLKTLGCYPPEYNRAVHGTYYPWRYYGPKDTNLGDVKLADLKSWLLRRNKSPRAMVQSFSRVHELWAHKWVRPIRSNAACLYQFMAIAFVVSYTLSYKAHAHHRHRKYH